MTDIINNGKTKVSFLITCAAIAAPTVAELNAGEPFETYLLGGIGLDPSTDTVDTTSVASTVDTTRPGRLSMSGESVFKDQGRGVAPWTTLADEQAGFLVVRRQVDRTDVWATGDKVETYTVKAGQRRRQATAANEVSKFSCKLRHSATPSMDAVVV